ncbi:hypothetical protein [Gordonia sp. DT101]|uniref:hypothetical protein n=1 Tax=Gordonia sp. DT101 TaxID=3416545 RepID=UPI003CEEF3E5
MGATSDGMRWPWTSTALQRSEVSDGRYWRPRIVGGGAGIGVGSEDVQIRLGEESSDLVRACTDPGQQASEAMYQA